MNIMLALKLICFDNRFTHLMFSHRTLEDTDGQSISVESMNTIAYPW